MNRRDKVLVVEDEMSVRCSLARILQFAGCEVTSVSDGEQALHSIGIEGFDLVYLDVKLPGMDGLELFKKLRQIFPDLSVIFLTAHASVHLAKDALNLGAEDFLVKPINPEVLISKTRVFLSEKRKTHNIKENKFVSSVGAKQGIYSRHNSVLNSDDRFIQKGSFILDLEIRQVIYNQQELVLSPLLFDCLKILILNSPNTVDSQALEGVFKKHMDDCSNIEETVEQQILDLKEIIDDISEASQHIQQMENRRYRFLV